MRSCSLLGRELHHFGRVFPRLCHVGTVVGLATAPTVGAGVWAPAVRAQESEATAELSVDTPTPITAAELEPLLGEVRSHPLVLKSTVAVQVMNLETGDEVFSLDGDAPLIPASVTKALTAAAALRTLGPTYRFTTDFLRVGEINEDGVLEGDLYIRGTGDPSLVVEKLWKMFQDLQVEGIVEIDGDIIFDDMWFDREYLIAGWRKKVDMAAGPAYFAPISALSLNFNTVSIVVAPAMKAGEPARVQLETPAEVIQLVSEVETVRAGKRSWIQIEREIDPKTHVVTFTMEGAIPAGGETERHYRSVGNPIAWTMSATDELFEKTGIKLNGRFKLDETPEDAELVVHHVSQPLHELLNHTNKYSSNIMAEHILKAMGAEVKGEPGTTEKGLEVVREYLDEIGIPRSEYTLVNGSGLTREASLAPSHVNAIMMDMFHHPQLAPEFMASLSVGGVDGTLRRRFDEVPGAVRGKTGSLNGVYCLTSYVRAQTGETYAMTFFANDLRRSRPARALQDTIGEAIMGWSGALPETPENEAE